jgi:hypothetical protein
VGITEDGTVGRLRVGAVGRDPIAVDGWAGPDLDDLLRLGRGWLVLLPLSCMSQQQVKPLGPPAETICGARTGTVGLAETAVPAGSSGGPMPDYDAAMPFEDSLPLVAACLLVGIFMSVIWTRRQTIWLLASAAVLVVAGIGAFVADQLVVTDREYLQDFFPRLAFAAERQDVATIMAALDPELRPLRDSAEQVLKHVRPKEVVITKLQVAVEHATQPPKATAAMIVRVTGEVMEKGSQATVLVAVKVLLHKKSGDWLIRDAEVEQAKPGENL